MNNMRTLLRLESLGVVFVSVWFYYDNHFPWVNIFRIDTVTGFDHVGLLFRLKSRGTMLQSFSHIRVPVVVYWNWINVRQFDLGYARTDMDCAHSD